MLQCDFYYGIIYSNRVTPLGGKTMIDIIDYIDIRIKSCELLSNAHFNFSKECKLEEDRIRCEVLAGCYKREVTTLQIIRRLLKAKSDTSYETIKGGGSDS